MSQRVRMAKPRGHRAKQAVRFVSGQPISGQYKTNHKWGKRGTQPNGPLVRATRWDYAPMRRRAGIRLVALGAVIAIPVGFVISVSGTSQTLRVIVLILIMTGTWVVIERCRRWNYRQETLIPAAEVVARHLKDSRYTHEPKEWMNIPYDVLDGATTVYLDATHQLTDTQERALAKAVSRTIGLVHPTVTFQYQGARPYMELRPAPTPSDLVAFSDAETRALVENADEGAPLLGLGPRDTPCLLDLDTDAPHIGFSMATNAGKSVAARALIMQVLHKGGLCLILDRKQVSQAWCKGLPNIRYASSPKEIHEALLWLSDEIDRRFSVINNNADIRGHVDAALVGPRLLVVAEELNTLEMDVGTYWRGIRDAKAGDPIKPTSLAALGRAMAMGRAGRVNVIPIGQKLTAQAIGGTAARENMSTRVLGRASTSTWNMLAPECKVNGRYPRKSMHRGRVYVVSDDEATLVQVLLASEEDARAYSLSGTVVPFPREAGHEAALVNPQDEAGEAGTSESLAIVKREPDGEAASLPHPAGEPDETEEIVTLSDASERLGVSLKTLRNARDRDPQFPDPARVERGKPSTYHFIELEKWAITRAYGTGGQ